MIRSKYLIFTIKQEPKTSLVFIRGRFEEIGEDN